MAIARDGYVLIAVATALALAAFVVAAALDSPVLWSAAYVFVLLAVGAAFLFRDPERRGERGPRLIVAPADGRIVRIDEVAEPEYVKGPAKRVSTFLSILDVHVQRAPADGIVEHIGEAPARRDAGAGAHQVSIGIRTGEFRIMVRHAAGGRRQRAVAYVERDARVAQGDRIGMIRLGSSVDLFVPPATTLRVRVGDRVKAGHTVVGEFGGGET